MLNRCKPVYEILAKRFKNFDYYFMNYGYVPFTFEKPLSLLPEDETNRYSLQLYHYLCALVDLSEKEMLEIGSGRGGGCYT